ncbi:HlyD family secretion protein [uncultured Alsobacter sp.]|uniref:HlyD family secretion protein n=1 Tax=uncultured Alsobacter sp. TaxID=1748258 RepID=UPI0025D8FFD9|nr:HlyD family secretion protein [uncultured Alsobacter sp.]
MSQANSALESKSAPDTKSAAEAKPAQAAAPAAAAAPRKRGGLRFVLLLLIPGIAAGGGFYAWLNGGRYISTDNAYVGAQKVLITPEVSGKVTDIAVREGQHVAVGDALFTVDPEPYRIAVQQARAKLAQTETEFATLKATLASVDKLIVNARQTVALREADAGRKTELLGNRSGSRADVDNAEINATASRSQLEQLEQQKAAALNQLQGQPDLPLVAYPPHMDAQAALDRARRDLDNTLLKAPIAGTATQVTAIQMGRYLSAGTPVFSIVSDADAWIDANPKETDLTYMKLGQDVTITVDAYPDRVWHGRVAAISPGTGAQFAILPPQNASGNWVKVVQRVPVRIEFAPGEDTRELRAGMSTNVEIDTRRERSLASLLGLFATARPAGSASR